jgi:hypothetical protein
LHTNFANLRILKFRIPENAGGRDLVTRLRQGRRRRLSGQNKESAARGRGSGHQKLLRRVPSITVAALFGISHLVAALGFGEKAQTWSSFG